MLLTTKNVRAWTMTRPDFAQSGWAAVGLIIKPSLTLPACSPLLKLKQLHRETMPTALSDPSPTLYGILVIITLVMAGIWVRTRTRNNLTRFLIALGALGAVYLIDKLVESPREESSRKVEEMAKASRDKNWDDLFKNVSDSFTYKGPAGSEHNKTSFRELFKAIEAMYPDFKGLVILDIHRADYRVVDEKTGTVGFTVMSRDNPTIRMYIVATFRKEADGQWRMIDFKGYDELKQEHRGPQVPIPGLDSRLP